MKKFIALLISITGITLVQTGAIAQEAEGCFMVNSSGETVDLAKLCGGTAKKVLSPNVFQAKIKRRDSAIPVIDVTFNGKHKFEMLLDTGATQTTITKEMADAIGMVLVGKTKAMVANGDVVESPVGHVASIKVGDAVLNEAKVSVGAVPLLGQNFFSDYDLIIRRDVVEFHLRQQDAVSQAQG